MSVKDEEAGGSQEMERQGRMDKKNLLSMPWDRSGTSARLFNTEVTSLSPFEEREKKAREHKER